VNGLFRARYTSYADCVEDSVAARKGNRIAQNYQTGTPANAQRANISIYYALAHYLTS